MRRMKTVKLYKTLSVIPPRSWTLQLVVVLQVSQPIQFIWYLDLTSIHCQDWNTFASPLSWKIHQGSSPCWLELWLTSAWRGREAAASRQTAWLDLTTSSCAWLRNGTSLLSACTILGLAGNTWHSSCHVSASQYNLNKHEYCISLRRYILIQWSLSFRFSNILQPPFYCAVTCKTGRRSCSLQCCRGEGNQRGTGLMFVIFPFFTLFTLYIIYI